jgi:phosphoserine phosphatase RsbU/P
MEDHNNMFFTIWYGVYDKETKEIQYASGGHPPAILITGKSADKVKLYELKTPGIAIGVLPEADFQNATCKVEDFNRLYVFSDGVYEVQKSDGSLMTIHEFILLLMKTPRKKGNELDYIVQFIEHIQSKTAFNDDFSLLQVKFQGG